MYKYIYICIYIYIYINICNYLLFDTTSALQTSMPSEHAPEHGTERRCAHNYLWRRRGLVFGSHVRICKHVRFPSHSTVMLVFDPRRIIIITTIIYIYIYTYIYICINK